MKNSIIDLRNHLFVTIEALLDEDKPMDLARANAVAEVAQVLVNSAKAESEFLRTVGQLEQDPRTAGTGFIAAEHATPRLINGGRS